MHNPCRCMRPSAGHDRPDPRGPAGGQPAASAPRGRGRGLRDRGPAQHLRAPAKLQSEVRLYTHLAIREDIQLLFGFLTETERRLFRALIKVNGVGARTALGAPKNSRSGSRPRTSPASPGSERRPASASSSSCAIGSPTGGAACSWAARHRPAIRSATGTIDGQPWGDGSARAGARAWRVSATFEQWITPRAPH